VKDLVEEFRKEHDLQNKPLFFTGCSSGGSLALRLPGIMKLDGVFSGAWFWLWCLRSAHSATRMLGALLNCLL
jgi:surfactin synthase thioesterase subunit